jgi:hypothetical protein
LVRPFDLRDIWVIHSLQDRGFSLDLEGAILQPRTPMWDALLGQLPLNGFGAATYVVRPKGQTGFIQAREGRSPAEVYLTYLAPALSDETCTPRLWHELLDTLCQGEGARGAYRTYAKLPADAEMETEVFREAGFRIYTQEHVFRLVTPTMEDVSAGAIRLRPWQSKDAWGVHRLYCMTAPRFVQQAEHLPGELGKAASSDWAQSKHEERYVWAREGEIVAYVQLLAGEAGHWLHLLVHPATVDQAELLVKLGVSRIARMASRPVFCTVRTYEAALMRALRAVGFREYQTRFLLVKQTAVWARKRVADLVPQVEGIEAAPTASARMRSTGLSEAGGPVSLEVLNEVR